MGRRGDDTVLELDRNFLAAWIRLGALIGAEHRSFGGVEAVHSGVGIPFFNPAFVVRPLNDPETEVGAAIDYLAGTGDPFILHLRDGVEPRAEAVAHGAGLTPVDEPLPGMVLHDPRPPEPDPGLDIRRVRDENDLAAFQEIAAASFGMDPSIARRFFPPSIMTAPDLELYLGLQGREPVGCSSLFHTDRTAGIYNVGTLAEHRGRGLGTALSWHAVRRGVELRCDRTVLQSSPMGRSVYERMGFREVVRYHSFTGP